MVYKQDWLKYFYNCVNADQTPVTAMNIATLDPPPRAFGDDEFAQRCATIQGKMKNARIDLLWLTTEADVRYVTGFLTQFWQSPTRPWHVLLPQSGKPVAVVPSIGLPCMQLTWIDDIRTWSSPDPVDDGVSLLVDTMRELAGEAPRIGFPMNAETWVRCCWEDIGSIMKGLPRADWVDASQVIRSTRQIKSAAEIERIAYICNVTSRAFSQVPFMVHAGMSDIEAFRAFRIACLQQGADDPDYVVGKVMADGYDDIIAPPRGHVIEKGDVLILDTGCAFEGYYSDFDRNFAFGSVDALTASAHQKVWDATEAALAMVRPGISCTELFHAMQQIMHGDSTQSDAGVGRFGHGLGSQLTETPSISAFDQTVLQTGMVITLEPGYSYTPGKIMVHEENLLVTETGSRLLSQRAPRNIPVV